MPSGYSASKSVISGCETLPAGYSACEAASCRIT